MSVSAGTLTAEPRYHNLSPMVWPIGPANGAVVVVEGVEMMELVDTGCQISVLTEGVCTEFGLRILSVKFFVSRRDRGCANTIQGYTEANLTIPDLSRYNEDMLF